MTGQMLWAGGVGAGRMGPLEAAGREAAGREDTGREAGAATGREAPGREAAGMEAVEREGAAAPKRRAAAAAHKRRTFSFSAISAVNAAQDKTQPKTKQQVCPGTRLGAHKKTKQSRSLKKEMKMTTDPRNAP